MAVDPRHAEARILAIPSRLKRSAPTLKLALSAALVVGLAACGRRSGPETPGAQAFAPAASGAGYVAPPRATGALVMGDGAVRISGVAPPRAMVEITSPEGDRARVRADRRGGWTVRLASGPPRLYAVTALAGDRTLHAEGALVTAPGALSPAVVVRAGDAAASLTRGLRTNIVTVDYDPSGFIAVAGGAPPRAELALIVDGAPAAVGQADAEGRYTMLAANRRLALGPHLLQVRAPDRTAEREITLDPPSALSAPYQAWPTANGWRVEWALTGGGVQTTLILDPGPDAGAVKPAGSR